MNCMSEVGPSVQRSFRLSARTADLLDEAAGLGPESRNALADRLLGEALRLQRHPLISFRTGGSGERRPCLLGTRLDVRHVIGTWRAEGGDVEAAAAHFEVPVGHVRAALDYYGDFKVEVDAEMAAAEEFARAEYERWERRQRALA